MRIRWIEHRLEGFKAVADQALDWDTICSSVGFALGVKHLSSQQTYLAWQLHQVLFPAPVRRVLSDNGQEFARHFHSALQASGIEHWHTFPRTPKMNAHCERFNRTVQDEFLDVHEELRPAAVQPATAALARLVQCRTSPSLAAVADSP